MICETCHGKHGWWVNLAGRRIDVLLETDLPVTWRECPDCIGGIASCCDGGGSVQPEPEVKDE
jgi:hypothetical protein